MSSCLALTFPALVSAQGGRGEGRAVILEQAPTDRAIAIPTEKLAQYFKDMDAKKQQTLRMVEGGKFNVNIRRIRPLRRPSFTRTPPTCGWCSKAAAR